MSLTKHGETTTLGLIKAASGYYLGMLTVAPTETSNGSEVSGNGYARQSVTFSDPVEGSSGAASYMTNSAGIEFPTATGSWGTVVAWGLWDASTGGNLVWYGNLAVAKELSSNDTILVHSGDLKLTID